MQITTDELRLLLAKVLDHLDASGNHVLNVEKDYYWAIPFAQQYDPYNEPTKFTLGQLSDDLAELKRIVDGRSSPIGYALVWLSTIMRAIGQESVG